MKLQPSHQILMATAVLSTALELAADLAHAADVVSTFKSGAGLWSVSANWTNTPALGGFPNNGNAGVATYDANVPSGTVTLDTNIVIQKFTQSSGTVTGSFNLSANDVHTWTGGALMGAGTNFDDGGLAITGTVYLVTRQLEPMVSATLAGGSVHMSTGGVIDNSPASFFNILDDSSVFNDGGATPVFLNQGTLVKSSSGNGVSGVGVGFSEIAVPVTNSGTLSAQSGTLEFTASYIQTAGLTVVTGGVISASVPMQIQGGSVIGTTQTAGLPSGSTFPKGTTTNTFVLTDASGNVVNCAFTVTIIDTEFPTITCPTNLVLSTSPGLCMRTNVTYAVLFGEVPRDAGRPVLVSNATGDGFRTDGSNGESGLEN